MWQGTRNDVILATGRQNATFAALMGAVAMGAIATIMLHAGYPLWRVLIHASAWLTLVGAQFAILRWVRGDRSRLDVGVRIVHVVAQLYLVTTVAITGGLRSPMLPVLGSAAALPVVFFGVQATARWLTASLIVLFALVALMPTAWIGPTLPHGHFVAVAIVAFVWTVVIVTNFVRRILSATETAACAVDVLNEERVAAAAEHAGRLQAVGERVAHELKNPLASIKGLVQLVARAPEAPRTRERLEVMQAELARMETILAEYLSFSRPLEDLRPQPLDLAEAVSSALTAVAGRVDSGRIAVHVDARPTPLAADPRRLSEALLNVLTNAVEATPPGGTIRIKVSPAAGDTGVVEIHDSGRGIKPEDLARLGTSYFTTREGGTGLGVVLAQTAIAQHGGTIHYASEPGQGTTVTIRLPARPAGAGKGEVLTTSARPPIEPAA